MKLVGWALVMCLCAGCQDPPKGRVSQGPHPDAGADAGMQTRLVYATASAVDTIRVVKRMRARLQKLGIAGDAVSIVGDTVHVDVDDARAAAVKEALAGGRLDVFMHHAGDPLADYEPPPGELRRERERVGEGASHFLSAPAAQKDALLERAREHAGGAETFVGPAGERYRSYYGDARERLRGEYLTSATAKDGALLLGFEGAGRGFVARHSKAGARLLVVIDGEVVALVAPTSPIDDGVLSFKAADAAALAAALDGRALSGATAFVEQASVPILTVP
jgi:hypothetical protein